LNCYKKKQKLLNARNKQEIVVIITNYCAEITRLRTVYEFSSFIIISYITFSCSIRKLLYKRKRGKNEDQ